MLDTGKVFISHAHEDNARCAVVTERLRTWGVEYWIDLEDQSFSQELAHIVTAALDASDTLLRLSTPAAARSDWMQFERERFLALLGGNQPRHFINVVLDDYEPDSTDTRYRYIDGRGQPQAMWLDGIRKALGKEMGWIVFDSDDRDYLWWVHTYRDGYVVNADRRPYAEGLTLHRASCPNISDESRSYGFVEGNYIKVCTLDRSDLERWARERVGTDAILAKSCACMKWGVV